MAAGAEHEAEREVGRGLGDRAGAVGNPDAALRALHRVDGVEAHGRREDDPEVRAAVEELAVNVRVGEEHEAVGLREPLLLHVLGLAVQVHAHLDAVRLQVRDHAVQPACAGGTLRSVTEQSAPAFFTQAPSRLRI